MNFDLSEEQAMLRDLVDRFGADRYDPARRLAYLREPRGFADANWAMLAETGLLAFTLPEEAGGFGGSAVDIITVMEALGRCVVVEPVLPAIILGAGLVAAAGTDSQKANLLPAIAAGEAIVAAALFERQARFDLDGIKTRVHDGRISGAKQMVLCGSYADHLLVAARTGEGALTLHLVKANAPGITITPYRLVDGSIAADMQFVDTPAQPMAGGEAALAQTLDQARLAICGELLGLMDMMFAATLDYIKTRQQFGQPIGSFQAIQHRMADCYARVELSRSHLYRAAAADGATCAAAVMGAKAYIAQSAMQVGEEAVQLHGGIGTTEELMVGQAFKRVMMLATLLGDTDHDICEYIAMTSSAADRP
ncbi:acyl-CoA/acyl-ACP dehydrogenase [Sphingobium sp. AS12]|uniref:acyl-CoA dehydrogenase family protein n=1 Tax=Sphingobium sp. AS12 TaxID=2849495 RepID=UPI001C3145B3|nr:acyl-CoA dehydrogenase family protein [Sphingobium sp. AS12]MBV2150601.1 acyl-CoA/acyl-ACP dehydrogenase [Sphingobium sp. AS12]